ncbi:MAG: peptide chain release factor 3 [Spirochaeta sp.]|jgi:peptide chain release factor 3|nr:peptide chain release factor 3 [Spirochaeta sp.]
MDTLHEIDRRRTFAVISHPDAGKTTLTEKLRLFGGGIRTAGAVKSNKIKKTAASDFMEIEKQRGISVATAVMSFEYDGKLINILDTPGHKDFAEDTYRTLTAVDSVILVVDSVKGVEEQTEKLMHVCRMRSTPVIVFINKLDREGRPPLELLDELEEKLDIRVRPMTWPINMGSLFKGVYNLHEENLYLFKPGKTTVEEDRILVKGLNDPALDTHLGTDANRLRENVELVEGVYDPFSVEDYRAGTQAPVFFGSALNNFGVRELLETFVSIAPRPVPRPTNTRFVDPVETTFSGFIFKIHANLDPRHRDRIAFLRVCSGTFERSKQFLHVRQGKQVRFTSPYSFMAEKKTIVDEAFPGDVVGLYDRGDLKIGDTLTDGEELEFRGIPAFSPSIFREMVNMDPMRSKQFHKGLKQLTEEGVAQLFTIKNGNRLIVGTVGELQFDVITYRLEHEYGAAARTQPLPYTVARWVTADTPAALEEFMRYRDRNIVWDKDDKPVYLAESPWVLNSNIKDYPGVTFHETSEFKTAVQGRA